jgi:hypothetical protein
MEVDDTSEACGIPECPHHAVTTLELLVDDCHSVWPLCQSHANWCLAYIEEDANVRRVHRLTQAAQEPLHENGDHNSGLT